MTGLIVLLAVGVYLFLAYKATAWISSRFKNLLYKILIWLIFLPLILTAPLADEIIGNQYYKQLCQDAGKITYFGKIKVSQEYFNSDGTPKKIWSDLKLSKQEEIAGIKSNFLSKRIDYAFMPIIRHERQYENIYNAESLVSYFFYSTPGGWLSRSFETPIIAEAQCISSINYAEIYKNIFYTN